MRLNKAFRHAASMGWGVGELCNAFSGVGGGEV